MGKDDHDEMQLRVSKAIPTDVGHGRARISGEMIWDSNQEILWR